MCSFCVCLLFRSPLFGSCLYLISYANNMTNKFSDGIFKSGNGSNEVLHPVNLGPELLEAAGLQQVMQILKAYKTILIQCGWHGVFSVELICSKN